MIYIEKHPTEVIAYEQELQNNQLDMLSLSDSNVHPSMEGDDVYEQVRSFDEFGNLKQQLLKDQGGVCCYCGCRLPHPIGHPPYIVEHLIPKSSNRLLAGEYQNLLLSCRGGLDLYDKNSITKISKKYRIENTHCDNSKEDKALNHTPLHKDCADYFSYHIDGKIEYKDLLAETDGKVLNLDCEYLNKRRESAIEQFVFDENYDILTDEELATICHELMGKSDKGIYHEFYYVIADAIKNDLS